MSEKAILRQFEEVLRRLRAAEKLIRVIESMPTFSRQGVVQERWVEELREAAKSYREGEQ